MPQNLQVCYLEPDISSREGLITGLKNYFQHSNFLAEIRVVQGAREVVNDALNGRVDVFVCDLSLQDDNAPLGLQVIAEVKKHCPWLFCISVSRGEDFRMTEVESQIYCYDLFIPKVALTSGDKAILGEPNYVNRFLRRFRYSPIQTYSMPSEILEEVNGLSVSRESLLPLLRQIFSYQVPIDSSVMPTTIEVSELFGGRSASRVFFLKVEISTSMQSILPVVLKVSTQHNALEEKRRYDSYVRWALPHQVRVDLMASAITVGQGAVLYSFASGNVDVFTFRESLAQANYNKCMSIVTKLFQNIGSFWQRLPISEERSLPERYLNRYFDGNVGWFNADLSKIREFCDRLSLPINYRNHSVDIGGNTYPALGSFLQSGAGILEGEVADEWSVVHGDLNPSNIIISNDDEVVLIDFRDSGMGHRYEDCVTLEGSMRMHWNWDSKMTGKELFLELLETENRLNVSTESLPDNQDNGWKLISHVRTSAEGTLSDSLSRNYFYALAYYCMRLMRIDFLDDEQRVRILACAFSSARAFQCFGKD